MYSSGVQVSEGISKRLSPNSVYRKWDALSSLKQSYHISHQENTANHKVDMGVLLLMNDRGVIMHLIGRF